MVLRLSCISLQFKQIAQAYEILADEKKRKVYDEGGEDALKEGGGRGGHSAMDIFDMFFGGGRGRRERRTRDMVHPLRVSATGEKKITTITTTTNKQNKTNRSYRHIKDRGPQNYKPPGRFHN